MKGRTALHFGFRWGAGEEKEGHSALLKRKKNKMKVRRQAPHLKEKKRNEKGTRPFSVNKQGEKKEKGEKGESPRFSQIREDLDLKSQV